jgi:four helix bundle protein
MTYQRFEDIPVWQAAILLAERVFSVTADRAFAGQGDLANQIQRAGLSVSNNIAEGFERGSTNELIAFLYYARGSAGEVRSMLCLMERMERFKNLKSQISDLRSQVETCSRQLRGWLDHLQNTPIRGQRHLNDDSRAAYSQEQRSAAFLEKLKRMTPGGKDGESEGQDLKSQI